MTFPEIIDKLRGKPTFPKEKNYFRLYLDYLQDELNCANAKFNEIVDDDLMLEMISLEITYLEKKIDLVIRFIKREESL